MAKETLKTIATKIPEYLHTQIKETCEREGTTITELIRNLLENMTMTDIKPPSVQKFDDMLILLNGYLDESVGETFSTTTIRHLLDTISHISTVLASKNLRGDYRGVIYNHKREENILEENILEENLEKNLEKNSGGEDKRGKRELLSSSSSFPFESCTERAGYQISDDAAGKQHHQIIPHISFNQWFKDFWSIQVRKERSVKAQKVLHQILAGKREEDKRIILDSIMTAYRLIREDQIDNVRSNGGSTEYIPLPCNWLIERRWEEVLQENNDHVSWLANQFPELSRLSKKAFDERIT